MAAKHERPQRNDVVIAVKAMHYAPGLSTVDRKVGALILEHYNKTTGQCDPGNSRLATMLGIDERTVRRATAELCGPGRLFWKVSHGGKYGRASYTPQWAVFRAIVARLDRAMATGGAIGDGLDNRAVSPGSDPDNRAISPGSDHDNNRAISPGSEVHDDDRQQGNFVRTTGRNGPVLQGETALQTPWKNPKKEPIGTTEASEYDAARDTLSSNSEQMAHGLGNGNARVPMAERSGSRSPSARDGCTKSEAARKAAQRRLDKAIGCEAHEWRSAMWLLEPEDMDAAISAEIGRRGQGIALLRLRMQAAGTRYEAGLPARGVA